jgi:hypothetical protein
VGRQSGLRTVDVIESLGVGQIGRWWVTRLVAHLEAHGRGERPRPDDEMDEVIRAALWEGDDEAGNPLPVDLRWQLVLAALAACPEDDRLLWCLGDGPFDNLGPEVDSNGQQISERRKAERASNPKLRRLYEAMRRTLPAEGVTSGPWFE